MGRTEYQDDTYRAYIRSELERFVASEEYAPECMEDFCKRLHYLSLNPADAADYGKLNVRLQELTGEQEPDGMLYYLATPPSLYGVIPPSPQGCPFESSPHAYHCGETLWL